ncbi:MAG: hemolysin III family protein [Treponema sp.]|nr:hemolysin III family protein [Treponema sp.]MCL2272703.1 hemolysin III family protein [Treponema sp.]
MNKINGNLKTAVLPFYTIREEIANSILHGIGTLAAITGLVFLNLKATGFLGVQRAGSLEIISVILFATTMIVMFLTSTLYHAVQNPDAKRILRKLDHCVIFIFIAGTYTPFCLGALRGWWGWGLFIFEWLMVVIGITLNILDSKALKKFELAVYILMGWAIIAGFLPLLRSVPVQSIVLLIAGGAAYTLGTVWYRMKNIRFTHVVWHVFVIIGTICHWFSIWFLI